MRFIGLDVHLDFCEIAICEADASAPAAGCPAPRKGCGSSPTASVLTITSRWRRPATRWRSRGRWRHRWRESLWPPEPSCGRSPRRRSRPTTGMRRRSRGCSRRGCSVAAGCRTKPRGRCVGVWLAARSSSVSARAQERGPRRADAQPQRPPADDGRLRQARPRVAGRARVARRRVRRPATGALRQIDFLDDEIAILERSIAEHAPRVARRPTAHDHSGREPDDGDDVHGRRRRYPPISGPEPTRRLPRTRSPGPPVGFRARTPRTDLKQGASQVRQMLVRGGARRRQHRRDRCARSTSVSARAAELRSPSSPSPASSRCCSGTSLPASRTTPSSAPR